MGFSIRAPGKCSPSRYPGNGEYSLIPGTGFPRKRNDFHSRVMRVVVGM